jgi:hypothetical protein
LPLNGREWRVQNGVYWEIGPAELLVGAGSWNFEKIEVGVELLLRAGE